MVGGTICTALNEKGTLSVSADAGALITENFYASDSVYTGSVTFDLTENLGILSENMTVDNWNRMIALYRESIDKDCYDGVIFAHGTDTLAYSAALFAQILSDTDIPVIFVSSNARLTSPRANGNDNFRAAVECIARGITPNVYAVYRNITDGKMYLHLASRLMQCGNYSEDFYSSGAMDISRIDDKNYGEYFEKLRALYPMEKRKSGLDIYHLPPLFHSVLMLRPYVGLRYDVIDYSKFSAVLHGTYHSGTACAEAEQERHTLLSLLDACGGTNTDVYFAPSKPEGEIYDTVRVIATHGEGNKKIRFLYGYTDETAYAKLLLAYSVLEEEDRDAFIRQERNFEKIDVEKG